MRLLNAVKLTRLPSHVQGMRVQPMAVYPGRRARQHSTQGDTPATVWLMSLLSSVLSPPAACWATVLHALPSFALRTWCCHFSEPSAELIWAALYSCRYAAPSHEAPQTEMTQQPRPWVPEKRPGGNRTRATASGGAQPSATAGSQGHQPQPSPGEALGIWHI